MMARNHGKSFFEAHWDWLVAGVGAAVAVGSFVLNFLVADTPPAAKPAAMTAGAAADDATPVVLDDARAALALFGNPLQLAAIDPNGSFLASRARTFCTPADGSAGCGEVLNPEIDSCTSCGKNQKEAKERILLDRDQDGMTDEYELAHGLNPEEDDRDEDLDGDGFTNYEEFLAKTNPNDPLDHPDYFESKRTIVKVLGMGNPTLSTLQFIGRGPYEIEYEKGKKSHRFSFYDASIAKTSEMTAFPGQEIKLERTGATGKKLKPISTGFILVRYNHKVERQKIRGSAGEREVDKSSVTLKRIADSAEFEFPLCVKGSKQRTVLDTKAKVVFDGVKVASGDGVFEVGKGDTIDLVAFGAKYVVEGISRDDEKPDRLSVRLKNEVTGKSKIILQE